ncbi:MAG: hypothetical protein QOK29_4636 [Rhodospirillaceae bacterium]|nr:hypothetical protein [Rhodospirillaceae bacterium]
MTDASGRLSSTLTMVAAALLNHHHFREQGARALCFGTGRHRGATLAHRVEVAFAQHSKPYWVKLYLVNAADASKEWRFLNEARERPGDGVGLRMPVPVAHLDNFAALVTEHVEGEMLSRRIDDVLHGALPDPGLEKATYDGCRMTGKWLATLHGRRMAAGLDHPVQALIRDIEARARRAGQVGRISESFADRVIELACGLARQIGPEDLVRVWTHGDYAPFNIILADRAVVALDPSFEESIDCLGNYCSRYEDLARFCVCIGGSPTDTGTLQRARMLSQFAGGYNGQAERKMDTASAAFAAFRLKYRLQALIDWWPAADCEPSELVHGW